MSLVANNRNGLRPILRRATPDVDFADERACIHQRTERERESLFFSFELDQRADDVLVMEKSSECGRPGLHRTKPLLRINTPQISRPPQAHRDYGPVQLLIYRVQLQVRHRLWGLSSKPVPQYRIVREAYQLLLRRKENLKY